MDKLDSLFVQVLMLRVLSLEMILSKMDEDLYQEYVRSVGPDIKYCFEAYKSCGLPPTDDGTILAYRQMKDVLFEQFHIDQ